MFQITLNKEIAAVVVRALSSITFTGEEPREVQKKVTSNVRLIRKSVSDGLAKEILDEHSSDETS